MKKKVKKIKSFPIRVGNFVRCVERDVKYPDTIFGKIIDRDGLTFIVAGTEALNSGLKIDIFHLDIKEWKITRADKDRIHKNFILAIQEMEESKLNALKEYDEKNYLRNYYQTVFERAFP